MILLVLLFALCIIPVAIVGSILLAAYPHFPQTSFVITCITIVIGIAWSFRKNRLRHYETSEQTPPNWLAGKKHFVILILATIVGSFAVFYTNKTDFYIDNGSNKSITVDIKDEGQVTIAPHSFVKKSVVKGINEVMYNNTKRTFDLKTHGKWIWNIDTLNTYVKSSITYSSETKLYKDKSSISKEENDNDWKIISDEFFKADVDYMFEAPKSISVKKRSFSGSQVKKTVLYRLNDFEEDESNSEENAENAKDSTTIEDNSLQETQKGKKKVK